MLKEVYVDLVSVYTDDAEKIENLWQDILSKYTHKKRYYHTMEHLDFMYRLLEPIQNDVALWDLLLFALFYHDYIYNSLKQDNEERSADKLVEILTSLQLTQSEILFCQEAILATKWHQESKIEDLNYLVDADLAILGADEQRYANYRIGVRKEYKYYPEFVYKKGRIRVLEYFLKMPRIYKTLYFYDRFEENAKENLQKELIMLRS